MSRRVTRLALCAAVVGAVVGADLADQARELRSQAFQTGVYGGAPLDLDSPELDDDFEIVLMQPHPDSVALLEEGEEMYVAPLPSPLSKDFAIGNMPDLPSVPAAAQEATKMVVKCYALAESEHSAELKSPVPDAIQMNAAAIFPAIPGKSDGEMATIRKSLATIADLLQGGSPVDRLPNVQGIPGLDDAGNKALLKMLKHIHEQSSKESAFPEGKMRAGLFGHFPIKVAVPSKGAKGTAIASDAAVNPPGAAGPIKNLPRPDSLGKPAVEVLKMDAPPLPTPDDPPPVATRDPVAPVAAPPVAMAPVPVKKPTPKPVEAEPEENYTGKYNLTARVMDEIHRSQGNQTSAREMGDHLVHRLTLQKGELSPTAQRCETVCGTPDYIDSRASDMATAAFIETYWRESRMHALNKALRTFPHLQKKFNIQKRD